MTVLTERLVLRRPAPADLGVAIEIHGDPATNRHNPAGPSSPEQAAERFTGFLTHWSEHGFGYWTMELADTGEIIGFGGVQHLEFDREPFLNLYYRLRPSAWGRGYAPEMVAVAAEWAERTIPELPVTIVTAATNEPAIRVATKVGFVEHRRADYHGAYSIFFRRVRRLLAQLPARNDMMRPWP